MNLFHLFSCNFCFSFFQVPTEFLSFTQINHFKRKLKNFSEMLITALRSNRFCDGRFNESAPSKNLEDGAVTNYGFQKHIILK